MDQFPSEVLALIAEYVDGEALVALWRTGSKTLLHKLSTTDLIRHLTVSVYFYYMFRPRAYLPALFWELQGLNSLTIRVHLLRPNRKDDLFALMSEVPPQIEYLTINMVEGHESDLYEPGEPEDPPSFIPCGFKHRMFGENLKSWQFSIQREVNNSDPGYSDEMWESQFNSEWDEEVDLPLFLTCYRGPGQERALQRLLQAPNMQEIRLSIALVPQLENPPSTLRTLILDHLFCLHDSLIDSLPACLEHFELPHTADCPCADGWIARLPSGLRYLQLSRMKLSSIARNHDLQALPEALLHFGALGDESLPLNLPAQLTELDFRLPPRSNDRRFPTVEYSANGNGGESILLQWITSLPQSLRFFAPPSLPCRFSTELLALLPRSVTHIRLIEQEIMDRSWVKDWCEGISKGALPSPQLPLPSLKIVESVTYRHPTEWNPTEKSKLIDAVLNCSNVEADLVAVHFNPLYQRQLRLEPPSSLSKYHISGWWTVGELLLLDRPDILALLKSHLNFDFKRPTDYSVNLLRSNNQFNDPIRVAITSDCMNAVRWLTKEARTRYQPLSHLAAFARDQEKSEICSWIKSYKESLRSRYTARDWALAKEAMVHRARNLPQ